VRGARPDGRRGRGAGAAVPAGRGDPVGRVRRVARSGRAGGGGGGGERAAGDAVPPGAAGGVERRPDAGRQPGADRRERPARGGGGGGTRRGGCLVVLSGGPSLRGPRAGHRPHAWASKTRPTRRRTPRHGICTTSPPLGVIRARSVF